MPDKPTDDKPTHDKDYEIVVNGQLFTMESETVTYEQLVALAFPHLPSPEATFSITFRKAKHRDKGSLVAGQSVEAKKKGTTFDVVHTGKS
jgi:hypothetical protein